MSAFAGLIHLTSRVRRVGRTWAAFAALTALLASGAALAQATNSIDAVTVARGMRDLDSDDAVYILEDLDEDEMARYLSCRTAACPFFEPGDEYKIVAKQN